MIGSDDSFFKAYDFKKPTLEENLVLHGDKPSDCGLRAINLLVSLGFSNVSLYEGGVEDWISNGGLHIVGKGHEEVDFEFVNSQDGKTQKSLLIDVRTTKELRTEGKIPGAINIPRKDLSMFPRSISFQYFRI